MDTIIRQALHEALRLGSVFCRPGQNDVDLPLEQVADELKKVLGILPSQSLTLVLLPSTRAIAYMYADSGVR